MTVPATCSSVMSLIPWISRTTHGIVEFDEVRLQFRHIADHGGPNTLQAILIAGLLRLAAENASKLRLLRVVCRLIDRRRHADIDAAIGPTAHKWAERLGAKV